MRKEQIGQGIKIWILYHSQLAEIVKIVTLQWQALEEFRKFVTKKQEVFGIHHSSSTLYQGTVQTFSSVLDLTVQSMGDSPETKSKNKDHTNEYEHGAEYWNIIWQ